MSRKTRTLPGGGGIRYVPATGVSRIPETRSADGAAAAPADAADNPRFEIAVSSEFVVERDFFGMRWREVLEHSPEAIQLTRFQSGRAAVLLEHEPPQVGVVDRASLDSDRVLRSEIRLSRTQRGRDLEVDIEDRIATNTSVGYIPKRARLVEENADLGDLWRITSWEPVEVSIVSVPADPTVGFGRSVTAAEWPPVEIEGGPAVEEERNMKKKVRDERGAIVEVDESDPRAAVSESEATAGRAVAPAAPPVALLDEQRNQRQEIRDLCDANRAAVTRELETQWISDGLSYREVAGKIVELRRTRGAAQPGAESLEGIVPEKDLRNYRYARAIMGLVDMAEGRKFGGLEAEIHQELELKRPASIASRGGVLVPMSLGRRQQRNLAAGSATRGAEAVFEQAGDLIELLRNRTAVIQLGARTLTGLSAPIAFPKQSGAMTAYWVGENPSADVTSSDIALGLALLAPKTLQGNTAYSRQLLVQSSLDIENMVGEELATVHSIAIDRATPHGLGAAGEPTGIYKAAGVSATAVGGAMSYAKCLAMQGQVAGLNADLGALGWLMNPTTATNLRGILDFPSSAAGRPIWTGTYQDGQVAGYRAIATNQVSTTMTGSEATGGSEIGNIFGNWNDVIIGTFSALELIVDGLSLKKRGMIEVTSFQMVDILARHGESFSKSTGATG